MIEFTNEFRISVIPDILKTHAVSFDKAYDSQRRFGFKAASQVSRKLTEEMHVPIASLASKIVTVPEVQLPPSILLTMKIDGLPTDVEIGLHPAGVIRSGDEDFVEATKKYLNRQVDVILTSKGYRQDGRNFYEFQAKDLGKYYAVYEGIHASVRISGGRFVLVVDPVTQIRAKLNLLDTLNEELRKRGIDHWRDALDESEEINRCLRGRAYNLRSTYVEPRRDDFKHNVYKFVGFRFDKSVSDQISPRSPISFHYKFGRKINQDQPLVEVIAQDGRKVDHAPELLEELPTKKTLKRFGASTKVHERSLKDANTRFYMTSELLDPLVKTKFIEADPLQSVVKDFGPVRLTVSDGYIEIKRNLDFQKVFEKGLLKSPVIDSIIVLSSGEDAGKARALVNVLGKVISRYKLDTPKVVERLDLPSELEKFYTRASSELEFLRPTSKDLVLVIFKLDEDFEDIVYNNLKRDSLRGLFPSQFIDTDTITQGIEDGNLEENVVNPMFLQIVAKCSGQPYGLQPGFVPAGTIFVGIDRYQQPFKSNSPSVVSITVFDSDGSYICGDSNIVPDDQISLQPILNSLLVESYKVYKSAKNEDASMIIFMIDSGVGTMREEFASYAQSCADLANNVGASYLFVSGNKNSHLRLYTGDPKDLSLTANKVSPFTVATKMSQENQILVVSTEPIISRKLSKEFGTPRAVLYTILRQSREVPLEYAKELLSKSIIWLCHHCWISPASTREPAPVFFANKLSRVVSSTGVTITPDKTRAPLFL